MFFLPEVREFICNATLTLLLQLRLVACSLTREGGDFYYPREGNRRGKGGEGDHREGNYREGTTGRRRVYHSH